MNILSLKTKIIRAIKFVKNDGQVSIIKYLPDSEFLEIEDKYDIDSGSVWDGFRVNISREFSHNPMGFLREPIISQTVHPNQQKLANLYLDELSRDKFSKNEILTRICELPVGNPYLCENFPLVSPMTIQHSYYLMLLNRYINLFLPTSEIEYVMEFGGGYGNFCRLSYLLGYKGEYGIIDFPEMHDIQKFFLQFSPVKISPYFIKDALSIGDIPLNSIFIATFSLNETPFEFRKKIENIYEKFKYLFFAYNSRFDEVDNISYFNDLKSSLAYKFDFIPIKDKHRNAWFLLGKRRD